MALALALEDLDLDAFVDLSDFNPRIKPPPFLTYEVFSSSATISDAANKRTKMEVKDVINFMMI